MSRNYCRVASLLSHCVATAVLSSITPVPKGSAGDAYIVSGVAVTLEKQEYLEGEPVIVEYETRGKIDAKSALLEPGPSLRFILEDEGGESDYARDYGYAVRTLLLPDSTQVVTHRLDLVDSFGERIGAYWAGWRLPPGQYKFSISVDEGRPRKESSVSFRVNPAQHENAEALRFLELGFYARFPSGKSRELGVKSRDDRIFWRKIVEEHPNTVYAPVALDLLITNRYMETPSEEVISDMKRLLQEYPCFYACGLYPIGVRQDFERTGKTEEGKSYLRALVEEHPNPEVVAAAREVLEKWEKGELK